MMMKVFVSILALAGLINSAHAVIANAWHIPSATQTGLAATMRDPFVEIAPIGSFTIYTGFYKNNGAGGNQNGGTVFYRKGTSGGWSTTALSFHLNVPSNGDAQNQFWKATLNLASGGLNAGANEVIQYYVATTFSDRDTTYLYGGDIDGNHRSTATEATAQAAPYSYRSRPAWIFHASNRVISGNSVSFWAKVGYIGDTNDNATRWANAGAVYYTTDGSTPAGALGVPSGTSQVAAMAYDHPEQNLNESGSITGAKPMWWVATAPNLLQGLTLGTTIKYRIGFWHTANNEEKIADFNAATPNAIFTFANGALGDPALTITTTTTGSLNGNYTTTKLFVDEIAGDSIPLTVTFAPGQVATEVELVTNLNQRDYADDDKNANGVEDGMEFNETESLIGSGADYYYRSYPMTGPSSGTYTATLNATKTGAYRLTARWKVSGDPNWRWFTNHAAARRDHAITVSPVTARDINLYEINTLTIEAKATGSFIERSTFEDLYDATGAPRTGDLRGFNLDYLTGLGVNWLWFQPVHPVAIEGRENVPTTSTPYQPGSPYAIKNFFEVNPWMSKNYDGVADISSLSARAAGMASFQGFVSAADTKEVGVMLDAPINHTGFDVELAQAGVDIMQRGGETWSPSDLIKNREARFFSKVNDYALRATGAGDIATAPDRGDFGKWTDVKDVYFGRYDALVNLNPADNGNHLNEGDRFFYAATGQGTDNNPENPNWTSDDDGVTPGTQNVTEDVWRYFARYATFWLEKTRPAGHNRNSTAGDGDSSARYVWDARGIDGLRCDFGQGVPPQCWEYLINVSRSTKWNFVMMAESLDGGAVTYRSNRHFDILNENIVFPLKSAGNSGEFKQIFEDRRTAYGQGLVLSNTTSHDEENYDNVFHALLRYYVTNTMDGAPLVFMGQELGVTRTSGFTFYETNFGKQVAHFKKFNSMQPAWQNRAASPYGEKFLFDAYAAAGQARRNSRALRGNNRYFLNRMAGGTRDEIWAVAKYETANLSPNFQDVVFAFTNLRIAVAGNSDTYNVNITQGPGNLFGIKTGRTYNVKNIGAYVGPVVDGFDQTRRNQWLWGANGRSGSDVLTNGVFTALNGVPEANAAWITNPFEPQYLKIYDVTAPPSAGQPSAPMLYAIGNSTTFTWTSASDPDGGISGYRLIAGTTPGGSDVFNGAVGNVNSHTVTGVTGQTLYVRVVSINNAGIESSASAESVPVKLLSPTGDEDADGMSNENEATAGTNPLSNASTLKVNSASRPTLGSFTITWQSVIGKKYFVQRSVDLGPLNWTDISTEITAESVNSSYTDLNTTGDAKFYRVRVSVP
ncbi:MAG: alpha-amylase family glycosyl hydrolase [Prosthecobacter sp.]